MAQARPADIATAALGMARKRADSLTGGEAAEVELIVVDIGCGEAVVEKLCEISDIPTLEVNNAARAADPGTYLNLRAETWWAAADEFGDGAIGLHHPDPELRRQLLQVRKAALRRAQLDGHVSEKISRRLIGEIDDALHGMSRESRRDSN